MAKSEWETAISTSSSDKSRTGLTGSLRLSRASRKRTARKRCSNNDLTKMPIVRCRNPLREDVEEVDLPRCPACGKRQHRGPRGLPNSLQADDRGGLHGQTVPLALYIVPLSKN